MKKLMMVLIALCLAISSFFVPHVNSFASAEYEESPIMVSEIKSELVSLLSSDARIIRKGGSDGEKNTLEYILSNLAGVSGLTAINNGYFNAGKQIVDFEDSDGFSKSTYNVGIRYPSTNASAKTISILTNVSNTPIITYSYDSNGNAKKNYNYVEAVNESAGSVAMMMAMAKYLANNSFTFNFNIDFIFCGAGDENSCGAQAYKRSISQDISKNPLIICLNKITVGDYNYFYAQDFSSEYEKYVAKYLNSGYGFKEFNKTTALVNNYSTNNEMAFAHAGIEGSAEVFAGTAFNLVSIFSGNYNGISSLGRPESSTHAELTKARRISEWIVNYLHYDTKWMEQFQEWRKTHDEKKETFPIKKVMDAYGLLTWDPSEHGGETAMTTCGGYSNLTQALFIAEGIPCVLIWREQAPTENIDHEYNAAYVNGKWIFIDNTQTDEDTDYFAPGIAGFSYDMDHRVDYINFIPLSDLVLLSGGDYNFRAKTMGFYSAENSALL